MTDELLGLPCATCGHFDGAHLIGAGVAYCDRFNVWHYPNKRNFDCGDHIATTALEGALKELGQALIWNRHARDWATGTNVGTPDEPQHATASKKELVRRADLGNEKQREFVRAYNLAQGTGL